MFHGELFSFGSLARRSVRAHRSPAGLLSR